MVSSCLSLLNAKMASVHRRSQKKKIKIKKNNNEVYVGIIVQNSLGTVILQKLLIQQNQLMLC